MTRKSKHDWLEEGLYVLAEVGASDLTIDTLTTRLSVTKGSFYHHFKGYQDFVDNLMAHFEEVCTRDIIAQTEQESAPAGKLQRLIEVTSRYPPRLDVAIRAWALHDENVRLVQERIDHHRLEYVRSIFIEVTGDEARARLMGQMLYAVVVGCEQLQPPIQGDDLTALVDEFRRLYGIA
jgi:AcrR family transcriptional regulator